MDDKRNLVDQYKGQKVGVIAADLQSKSHQLHIAIENLQHDFNIGSIVRSANAFNVASVHIVGKKHWNRRGAMMTEKYLDVHHHPDVVTFSNWVKQHDLELIGVDNIEGARSLSKCDLPKPCMLVFGQEGPGLSDEMLKICKYLIAIEQFGSTRSINVGAAAAVVMYEWVRRHVLSI